MNFDKEEVDFLAPKLKLLVEVFLRVPEEPFFFWTKMLLIQFSIISPYLLTVQPPIVSHDVSMHYS